MHDTAAIASIAAAAWAIGPVPTPPEACPAALITLRLPAPIADAAPPHPQHAAITLIPRPVHAGRPRDEQDAMRLAVSSVGAVDPAAFQSAWWEFDPGFAGPRLIGGANTTLADGNLGLGRADAVNPQTATDRHPVGFARENGTDFALYDLTAVWPALRSGALTLGLATGVKAVRADVDTESLSGQFSSGAMTAIPVVGADLRLDIADGFHLGGAASTQALGITGQVVDLRAEAGLSFTPKVGMAFGYQFIRSAVDAGPFDATLRQEGPFARIQIRF